MLGFVPIGTVRRRLRRRTAPRRAHSTDDRDAGAAAASAGAAAGDSARPPPLIEAPAGITALRRRKRAEPLRLPPDSRRVRGILALAVVPPHWAIPVAGATAIAALATLRFSAARSALSLSAVACIAAAGVLTVVGQIQHHYPPGDSWPGNFETAGILAFVGVVALMTDAVVELARRHRGVGAEPQPPEQPGSHERHLPRERRGEGCGRQSEASAEHRVAEQCRELLLEIPILVYQDPADAVIDRVEMTRDPRQRPRVSGTRPPR